MFNHTWKLSGFCFETEQMAAIAASAARERQRQATMPTPDAIRQQFEVDIDSIVAKIAYYVRSRKPSFVPGSHTKLRYIIYPKDIGDIDYTLATLVYNKMVSSGWKFEYHSEQREGVWYTLEEI